MEFIDLKAQYAVLKANIDSRIHTVLDHGQYIMGPEVKELEARLAAFTGAKHCITVASGTEALLISLMALGIKPGDEVITTPFTFAATAEVIVLLGARPVFVDIEQGTCNIDASKIEAAITSRTRAIMPVSLYGQVSDMDEINDIAKRNGNIPVIEDGAQSFGATYKGRRSCNLSTFGCTSFFPSKPLGCYGDGGAIFTNNDTLAQACREIRVHGQSARYCHTRVGVGGRMDTIQCAVVLGKLDKFDWELQRRKLIGETYGDKLLSAGIPEVCLLEVKADRDCVWGQYTVKIENRDFIVAELNKCAIPTAIHYPVPLDAQVVYREYTAAMCEISLAASKKVLSLPMHPYLSVEDISAVVERVAVAVGA